MIRSLFEDSVVLATSHLVAQAEDPAFSDTLHTDSASFQHDSDLEDKRIGVIKFLGNAAYLASLNDFFDYYLPALPSSVDISEVVTELKKQGVIVDDRFQDFASESEPHENTDLKPLFDHIISATKSLYPDLAPEKYTFKYFKLKLEQEAATDSQEYKKRDFINARDDVSTT
jgi:hypothetical protein